ncbi:MAG: polyribonucleotide nucleotidyltransferase [Candidatus Aquicultor secundus]|nr:polyribonucleotide nucleotidyltransferase [Candidatus Aquicultor secundus]NCO65563.1 polyribonucleotide nucleotidyltransferase [Solirubrobacter sp.]OIO88944.1 MAG: polyribonucleotide nucleotidyltransferase [Candidatus Aquicultor secundus]
MEPNAQNGVQVRDVVTQEFEIGGKTITFQSGLLARQADGAVTVQLGETMVLVTAVVAEEPSEGRDFLPLTVDVEEKMYAAGKIPGGFIKRETRPSEKATLTARLIDRPLRPSFPKGFYNDIQVIATVLSVDLVNQPDIIALNGASLALVLANAPFNGPVAGVRIGRVDGRFVFNPTFEELAESDLDMVVAGNRNAILMVEAGAKEVTEEDTVQALAEAHKAIIELCDFQEHFKEAYLKVIPASKKEIKLPVADMTYEQIEEKIREFATGKLREALKNPEKLARERQEEMIEDETIEELESLIEGKEQYVSKILAKIRKEEMRKMVLDEGIRADGRKTNEIRPILIKVGVLPRPHGSGLFTRGQTQALSVVTLGTVREEQMIDGLGIEESKRYMHHYNFPPFATGEIGFLRGPKRREIGHGALAERALFPVIPKEDEFPYTIRIVSEVLESNGSSSMASVCGSTLSLMDAGVPIKAPVAGIAMGLIKEGDRIAILTDILGMEDALGDMDFKVAGTAKGITALQMDMKVEGVGSDILGKALAQARDARLYILDRIAQVLPGPRSELSKYAPRIITVKIPSDKIGDLIGPKGKNIRGIIEEVGANFVTIDIEEDGTVFIASTDGPAGERARELVEMFTKEPKVGERFMGTVTKTTGFGAFVEILPGKEGLVHISRLTKGRVPTVESVVNVGDKIEVEVIDTDKQGKISLQALNLEVKGSRNE